MDLPNKRSTPVTADVKGDFKKGKPIKYFDFEFEQFELSESMLRQLILDEVILTHSSDATEINRRNK